MTVIRLTVIAAILAGNACDALGRLILIGLEGEPLALCAWGLAEDVVGTELQGAAAFSDLRHRLLSPRGA